MILGVYCIRDIKAGWLTPSVDQNDACAARNFVHAMKNTSSLLYTHPRDFDLFKIGEFDTEKGEMFPFDHALIISGSSCENTEV